MPLKLLKRGRIYYVRGAVAGKHVFQSTKLTAYKDAVAYRNLLERQMIDEYLYGEKPPPTVGEALTSYLETGAPARFLDRLADHFGRERVLKTIRQDDLDKAARTLQPNVSRETAIRHVYTPFIALWNHAARRQWVDMRMWERPRKARGTNVAGAPPRAGTRPIDYDTAAKFVAAMSPAPGMLMTFLFYTGLRPIEAFSLAAGDANLEGRWLVLRSTKTGEPRGVPMHEFIAEWLGPLVDRANTDKRAVFRTPRGHAYTPQQDGGGGLASAILGARRRSGINDVAPYTGRHSVSTQLVVNAVHPHIKDQILGHAADDMSRHYTNVPQKPLIDAINTLVVPPSWRALPWWQDPLGWSGKLAEGTGRRTDLERKK